MQQQEDIKQLFEEYIQGSATPEHMALLEEVVETQDNELLINILESIAAGTPGEESVSREEWMPRLRSILQQEPAKVTVHRVHFLKTAWFRYAAILLLIAGTATYFYISSLSFSRNPEVARIKQSGQPVITPAGNRAILTLADGSTIVLDSIANGTLGQQGNTRILKTDAGSLTYQAGTVTGEVLFNVVSTPKGGRYNILLPDGSKVWLNAASTIRFPTSFIGERKVNITGEAYFEIAKNSTMPFHVVSTGGVEIDVLGTSFNVNAYHDENSVNTTLIEGSVRMLTAHNSAILKPGEQARIAENIRIIKNADIDKALAWKNGLFNFEGVGLKEMMRQLERWYDIDVIYEGNVPDITFFGKMSRKVDLSVVLEALKGFGLHFKMVEGRKLVVMP